MCCEGICVECHKKEALCKGAYIIEIEEDLWSDNTIGPLCADCKTELLESHQYEEF